MDVYRAIDGDRLATLLGQVRLQRLRTTPKTGFYDLLIELRLSIYKLAYRNTPLKVLHNSWSGWPPSFHLHNSWSYLGPLVDRNYRLHLNSYKDLLVNKQYYKEAIKPFYGSAVWYFSNLDDLERFTHLACNRLRDNVRNAVVHAHYHGHLDLATSRLWSSKVGDKDLPYLECLTLCALPPRWHGWMTWRDPWDFRRALECERGAGSLSALRGLKRFHLQAPAPDKWWIDMIEELSHNSYDPRTARHYGAFYCAMRQLEAMIANEVCQPRRVVVEVT